ncbi:uncharacterized protein [Engystomops pustulosus]|uniref:uncharacterized protein n=1 Tax=Engystomops pustulosus TaxID=76066 RepID=UPI003AFA1E7C
MDWRTRNKVLLMEEMVIYKKGDISPLVIKVHPYSPLLRHCGTSEDFDESNTIHPGRDHFHFCSTQRADDERRKKMDTGYSPDCGSFYASIPPEELLRRLAFCAGFLPSPLFKMERLMPTNPAAQQQFLRKEEEPPRARAMDRTLLLRAAMVRELCADSDEEEERPCFIKLQVKKRKREEDSEEEAEPPRRRRMRQHSARQFLLSHQRRSWLKILLPGSQCFISARWLLEDYW